MNQFKIQNSKFKIQNSKFKIQNSNILDSHPQRAEGFYLPWETMILSRHLRARF
ncbi:hypothetical protein GXM_00508 [Nostoc sphaeroides CCNUC1]|uniref:Uncharacterized protein n=1 Tax=Nostoc sphaeroides CCNUC1 TaxID=2653204 RepID=A0A5P8VRJ6_9NOSO|nr:hypothetical protein GXM_00508 [Nostoc sphaeroides CCNUC1]